MSPRLAVALCTYNGAPFLPAQLDSILAQSRQPDALVVGDDGSTDGTLQILHDFGARAPFPVRILAHSAPMGVAANFASTIVRCDADLIATCDQDDVWAVDRLAQAESALADPKVVLVCSDAELVDATLRSTGRRLWAAQGLHRDLRNRLGGDEAFALLLARRAVTGTTMTIRRSLRDWALPIGDGWIHDEWLSVCAALRGRIAMLETPLVKYRQHGSNAIGAPRDGVLRRAARAFDGQRAARLGAHLAQLRSLANALERKPEVSDAHRTQLAVRIRHVEARLSIRGNRIARVPAVAREALSGRYAGDALGLWSAVQDLLT